MKTREQIINEAIALRNRLESQLSEFDLSRGWTEESQTATLVMIDEIIQKLDAGAKIPNYNIGRGLDHWGVEGGDLLESLCAFSNHLRDLN